jgi:hypothetical protein
VLPAFNGFAINVGDIGFDRIIAENAHDEWGAVTFERFFGPVGELGDFEYEEGAGLVRRHRGNVGGAKWTRGQEKRG